MSSVWTWSLHPLCTTRSLYVSEPQRRISMATDIDSRDLVGALDSVVAGGLHHSLAAGALPSARRTCYIGTYIDAYSRCFSRTRLLMRLSTCLTKTLPPYELWQQPRLGSATEPKVSSSVTSLSQLVLGRAWDGFVQFWRMNELRASLLEWLKEDYRKDTFPLEESKQTLCAKT